MAYAAPRDPTSVMGRRIVAFLGDFLLLGVVVVAVFFAVAEKVSGVDDFYCDEVQAFEEVSTCVQVGDTAYVTSDGDTGAAALSGFVLFLANAVVLQGVTGATLGKHLVGLRVVDAQGAPSGFGLVLGRSLLLLLAFVCFPVLVIAELIVALATKPHRRLGDMACGTYVVGKGDVGQPVVRAAPAMQYGVPPGYAPPAGYAAPQPAGPGGWAPPTAATASGATTAPEGNLAPAPQPAASAPQPPTGPQWDPQRNAWLHYEPTTGRWLRWDDARNEWLPLE